MSKISRVFNKFPRTFWVANTIELFERWAWYGFFMLFANYLTRSSDMGGLEFSQAQKGMIMGIGTGILYFLPVITGAIADKFGYKRVLAIAFLIYTSAFILLPYFDSFTGVFIMYLYLALGAALFKPIIQATVAKTTDNDTASIGFGIFYMMVNLGAFIGPMVTLLFKEASYNIVFNISAGIIALNFILLLFYKEPDRNKSSEPLAYVIPTIEGYGFWFGLLLAVLVGIVIIGGIKSIAKVTDKIVPFMAVMYVITALIIIFMNIQHTGEAFRLIWEGAFAPDAIKGGIVGVLIVGFQRAAFSNEAGVGSAAIAHSAVKTDKPITEGFVALLEPFVDTVVICTMTALVLIFTGTYENPLGLEGAQLTSNAFEKVFSFFPYILVIAIFLFAFSTMISWSYYGLKGFDYLFGGIFEKLFGNRNVAKYTYFAFFLSIIGFISASFT